MEKALRSKRKKCMIGTGAMCDPYMQCEERIQLARKCLELIEKYGYGPAIQTKSDRILPFLNDTEGNREYFYAALDRHFPGMREKYHKAFGYRYEIASEHHKELMKLFLKLFIEIIFSHFSFQYCSEIVYNQIDTNVNR